MLNTFTQNFESQKYQRLRVAYCLIYKFNVEIIFGVLVLVNLSLLRKNTQTTVQIGVFLRG